MRLSCAVGVGYLFEILIIVWVWHADRVSWTEKLAVGVCGRPVRNFAFADAQTTALQHHNNCYLILPSARL